MVTYYSEISPCGKTCAVTGWSSSTRKPKLTTSHIRVCWSPKVITHSPPASTVVDFQTTRCVGPAGKSISHQPQVTRSCESVCKCKANGMAMKPIWALIPWVSDEQTKNVQDETSATLPTFAIVLRWAEYRRKMSLHIKITWSTAVYSHILRMETVVNSIWASSAGGQPWFCTRTADIVQPDCSSSSSKPVEWWLSGLESIV